MAVFDEKEYDRIYNTYADTLYRLAHSHLKNPHDAEDALQEAFIAYFRHKGHFTDEGHRKAWLVRVLLNKCTDRQRKNLRLGDVPLDEIENFPAQEKDDGVLEAVMSLPEKYKTPILLHYFEGFEISEIALTLKISPSGVKMRLSRGREALRQILGGE